MGRVININNKEGESASVLTQTGKGGLLSSGYLRDEPAEAHLHDETPVFVLTNQKRGVEIRREEGVERVRPGSGYRTITVVTDRRIVVLVGHSSHEHVDGDQRLSNSFTEIEGITSDGGRRGGTLTVEGTNDVAWSIHAGKSGLTGVEEYVRAAIQAWTHVEATLDNVTRALVNALDCRDQRDYDDALDAAQAAADQLEDARRTAQEFTREWPGTAMGDRVDQVSQRCTNTLATVRVGRARQFADRGERCWREDELESAHDAYDRSKSEYEAVEALPTAAIENWERIEAEARRTDRTVRRLEEAPLQAAVDADRAAEGADDPEEAAEQLEAAIELYQRAITIDSAAEHRRFAGDPEDIRTRLNEVVEAATAERRNAATKAKQAGEWYMGTDQYDLAVDEFEAAREQFDRSIEVANDHYPEAVDHLETDRAAVEERLESARAARDGESVDPAETERIGDEPEYDVEATIGTTKAGDGNASVAGSGETSEDSDTAAKGGTELDLESRLRQLDDERFGEIVATVLGETGWSVEATTDQTVVVARESPTTERMLVRLYHRPDDEPVTVAAIEKCSELRRVRSNVDAVMMATSAGITDEATRRSRDEQVRLLDDECLAAVVESRDLETELTPNRIELE
jgi:tetratricopeptide (TPR) repeat protein